MAMAATFTHLLLWNRDDIRAAWTWMNKDSIKKMISEFDWRIWKEVKQVASSDADLDPHYREMLKVRTPSLLCFVDVDIYKVLSIPMPRIVGTVACLRL
jgi:hypothetical protein